MHLFKKLRPKLNIFMKINNNKKAIFLSVLVQNLKKVATGLGWLENSEMVFGDSWGTYQVVVEIGERCSKL